MYKTKTPVSVSSLSPLKVQEEPNKRPMRVDGRPLDQMRPVTITRSYLEAGEGSVLVEFGDTKVLCVASFKAGVPKWREGSGKGWVTAEYAMLPRATNSRNDRESVKGKISGRTAEISRLIGRSLRSVVDMQALGENTIMIDCDVLQADGGTRTASITGAYVALAEAIAWGIKAGHVQTTSGNKVLRDSVSAISVGIIDGTLRTDLAYEEDCRAGTDMNVVATGVGNLVEVQGTAEGKTFSKTELDQLLSLALDANRDLASLQREVLAGLDYGQGEQTLTFTGATVATDAAVQLVLATKNEHKVEELRSILSPLLPNLTPEMIISAKDLAVAEVVEDELTFAGNALLKARSLAKATGKLALADDSGICVSALGGAPGIFSARWSGVHGNDQANLDLLLAQLKDVPEGSRQAEFRCAVALVAPDGREWIKEAAMTGQLTDAPAGENGFGYDPIFIPTGYTQTSAQLSPEQKNAISHRGQALRKMAPVLAKLLEQ